MSRPLEITKLIDHEWTDTAVSRLKEYWVGRGFRFAEDDGTLLTARRGSLWWNPVAFDMKRLATTMEIRPAAGGISVTMRVCTVMQIITGWNRRHFDLEMETCESFLRSGDLMELEWEVFKKENRKASFLFVLTAGIRGDSPPDATGPE